LRACAASSYPRSSLPSRRWPPTTPAHAAEIRRADRDSLMDRANTARPARNLAVDFYRVSAVVLIVLGHWLAGSVTYQDGHFGRQNPLVDLP
jgi:hypothetical protein